MDEAVRRHGRSRRPEVEPLEQRTLLTTAGPGMLLFMAPPRSGQALLDANQFNKLDVTARTADLDHDASPERETAEFHRAAFSESLSSAPTRYSPILRPQREPPRRLAVQRLRARVIQPPKKPHRWWGRRRRCSPVRAQLLSTSPRTGPAPALLPPRRTRSRCARKPSRSSPLTLPIGRPHPVSRRGWVPCSNAGCHSMPHCCSATSMSSSRAFPGSEKAASPGRSLPASGLGWLS